jgi:aminoglycoside/choline kinase family phosphotransferase
LKTDLPISAWPNDTIVWTDPAREAAFAAWIHTMGTRHGVVPTSARLASADASFRRYFRVDATDGSTRVVMDAPPDKENCEAFVRIAGLLDRAGVHAPEIIEWDRPQGFLLITDMGAHTLMQGVRAELGLGDMLTSANDFVEHAAPSAAAQAWFNEATDTLVKWQLASRPDELKPYSDAVLQRELMLYPDWYLKEHKKQLLDTTQTEQLQAAFEVIKRHNLAAPTVHVHRDFMPRNLMVPDPKSANPRVGVLDFQDALHGPVTYDIACLMRDAFLSWDEAFVIDVTIRYWEKARKAGLITNGAWGDWGDDFGSYWRAVDFMALQRHLKVIGIFARLTIRDGKPKYLADAPRFVRYIRSTAERYTELRGLVKLLDVIEGMDADKAHLRKFGL